MIIGIQGFSSFASQSTVNLTDAQSALTNYNRANPVAPRTGLPFSQFDYSSTSPSLSLSSPNLTLSVLGPSSYGDIRAALTNIGLQPGDVFTIGVRLSIATAHANTQPVIGGFFSAGVTTAPTVPITHTDGSTTLYVEFEVSRPDASTYRYKAWINGVSKLNTTSPGLYSNLAVGGSPLWKSSTNPPGNIILSDMYWAWNKDGQEERLGSCYVRQVPRDVIAGVGNPGAAEATDITAQRAMWDLQSGSRPTPVTLSEPVVQKSAINVNASTRVKAYSMTTIGKPSSSATPSRVTSQIIDDTDQVVASRSREVSGSTYANGVLVTIVDVSSVPTDKLKQYKFVSSREKVTDV